MNDPTEEPPPREGGVCGQTDPELFHLDNYTAKQVRQALALCASCPILFQCADWAARFTWIKTVIGGRYYNRDGQGRENVWGDPVPPGRGTLAATQAPRAAAQRTRKAAA